MKRLSLGYRKRWFSSDRGRPNTRSFGRSKPGGRLFYFGPFYVRRHQ